MMAIVDKFKRNTDKADISALMKKYQSRGLELVKRAVFDLAVESNTPVYEGGNMPVDTSFLVNSMKVGVGHMPSGPDVRPEGYIPKVFDFGPIATSLTGLDTSTLVYLGWTAEYAFDVEYKGGARPYGFRAKAGAKWKNINNKLAKDLNK